MLPKIILKGRMSVGKKAFCVVIIIATLFTGCSNVMGSGSVEELLRAPQPTELLLEIKSSLVEFKRESIQLKYPRGNKELSPILLYDLDSDMQEEAIVIYTSESGGQNVYFSVLEYSQDEGWNVVNEVEGLSSEVMDFEVVNLAQDGTHVIVGYANATLVDKYFCVYNYNNNTVNKQIETAYTNYMVEDVNDDSVNDIILISSGEEEGALIAQWIVLKEDEVGMQAHQTFALDKRFVSCTDVHYVNSYGTHGIVIEGQFANGWLANEVFKYEQDITSFINWPSGEIDVVLTSLRNVDGLKAGIIDDNNTLRVPTNVTRIATVNNHNRFNYVLWQDYLGEIISPIVENEDESEDEGEDEGESQILEVHPLDEVVDRIVQPVTPRFGIYDSQYNYFLRLPNNWTGELLVTDKLNSDDWVINQRDSGRVLVEIKVTQETTGLTSYEKIASLSGGNVYVKYSSICSDYEKQLISTGIAVLQ